MPRRPRVFVEGGIYHVYNRFASGEPVFADPEEALEFIELLRYVKQRDGWTVFAWVLMSNHYHLAIRSRAVPISRGFQYLQGRFSQRFNRGRKRTGALWQSRYHAKPINEEGYLDRVILYIHLNPVAGGLVDSPADHVFGGHREIVKGISNPVIDIDDCLLSFGQTQRAARQTYLSAIRLGCRELGKEAGRDSRLPRIWFRPDSDLAPDDEGPYIDVLGRSTGPERYELSAEEFIERSAAILHIDVGELASRSRRNEVVEARRLIITVGRERWAQSTKQLASALQKSADTVTYIQREGVRQRLDDEGFLRRYECLDAALVNERN
jgi:REP element-mobilizing transposase RayT